MAGSCRQTGGSEGRSCTAWNSSLQTGESWGYPQPGVLPPLMPAAAAQLPRLPWQLACEIVAQEVAAVGIQPARW